MIFEAIINLQCRYQIVMTLLIVFSLLVLTLSQNCPYCNPGQCSLLTTGVSTCVNGQCASNAFSLTLISNGANYTYNGYPVWQCQLCSAVDPNCLTCQTDQNINTQMICSTCATGYAVSYAQGQTPNVYGTCVACAVGCLGCAWDWSGPVSAVTCSQCSPDYIMVTTMANSECYYCPPVSTAALANSSTQSNGLVIGLIIWTVLATVCSIVFITLYVRNRSSKGKNSQRLLNAEIEVGRVQQ